MKNTLVNLKDATDELYTSYSIDLAGYTTEELKQLVADVKHIYILSQNNDFNNN